MYIMPIMSDTVLFIHQYLRFRIRPRTFKSRKLTIPDSITWFKHTEQPVKAGKNEHVSASVVSHFADDQFTSVWRGRVDPRHGLRWTWWRLWWAFYIVYILDIVHICTRKFTNSACAFVFSNQPTGRVVHRFRYEQKIAWLDGNLPLFLCFVGEICQELGPARGHLPASLLRWTSLDHPSILLLERDVTCWVLWCQR